MERTIEFKNFEQTSETISAELYLEDEFVVKMTDKITHAINTKTNSIGLYNYFRSAVLTYISYNNTSDNQHIISATNSTNH